MYIQFVYLLGWNLVYALLSHSRGDLTIGVGLTPFAFRCIMRNATTVSCTSYQPLSISANRVRGGPPGLSAMARQSLLETSSGGLELKQGHIYTTMLFTTQRQIIGKASCSRVSY